jgi:hypothetical protein
MRPGDTVSAIMIIRVMVIERAVTRRDEERGSREREREREREETRDAS